MLLQSVMEFITENIRTPVRKFFFALFREPPVRKRMVARLKSAEGRQYWVEGGDLDGVIACLRRNPVAAFPSEFSKKYNCKKLYGRIAFDSEADRFYVLHKNRKICMKKGWSKKRAAVYFNSLLIEQDKVSPHCYRPDELKLTGDEVVVDAGAAEGIAASELLERVKRIFVFDMDEGWLDSLHWTFRDTDKVVIVPKGLGAKSEGEITTLDDYFKGERIDLIKADIEGAECDMVRGGRVTLSGAKRAVICAYHRENDARDLTRAFKDMGFETQLSVGYMIPGDVEELKPPYLRRGVLFAAKG